MWSFYFRVFWFHMGFFLFFVLCFLICICLFLVNIRNLRKEKGPEKVETNSERVVVFYFWPHKKIKKRKKKSKNKRGYTWRKPRRLSRLVMKYQNDKYKSWRTRMYMIGKISDPFLIDKRPIRQQYLYLG